VGQFSGILRNRGSPRGDPLCAMNHFARNLTFATALFTSGCPFAPRCWETATCPFIDSGVDGGSDAAFGTSSSGEPSAVPLASTTSTASAAMSKAPDTGSVEPGDGGAGDASDVPDVSAIDGSIATEPDADAELPDASLSGDADADSDSVVPPRSPCDEEGFVVCDAVCIDPSTDRDFCGATHNCESVGERCAGGEVCAGGECRNWNPAENTGIPGHTAVLSPDGRSGFAAWVQPDDHDSDSNTPDIRRVYAARWDGSTWGAPARLTTTAGDSSGEVRLAVDATGATVAWDQREESGPCVYAAHWNGAAWNTTQLAQGESPQVAEHDGESVVVWTEDSATVYVARRTNAGWGDGEPVSPISNLYTFIPVVAAEAGKIIVAWLGETADRTRSIYAATSNGSGWSDAYRVSTNVQPATSYAPAVAVGAGTSWVTWYQTFDHDSNPQTSNVNQTHVASWDGSEWSPSIRVSPATGETSGQKMAADGDGAIHVWAQRENIGSASETNYVMRLYASVLENGAWSNPTRVSGDAANVNQTTFSVAYRKHYGVVAWTESAESLSLTLRAARWDGSGWSEPALLTDAATRSYLGALSLTADGTRAWVSWRDFDEPAPGVLHISSFW
jgi:hypothetical protein